MLGRYPVDPPVVLAPMAGITNVAFRQLCREQGAGIYVCEMITTIDDKNSSWPTHVKALLRA
jgi:tRNA-dihydrouridine synthase